MAAGKWKARMGTHARVGAQLKDYRAKYKLTQQALADSIGCWPSAISKIERGIYGSMELMEGVLWALNLDLSDLRGGKHEIDMLTAARRRRHQPQLHRHRLRAVA
jgi:transcriptional regulator with XRE-family HTH domain